MESEEVLGSIMSKLKEYKANPLPSPVEEKQRQKHLMKMFCIYTSLKKREKAREKQMQCNASIHKEENEMQEQCDVTSKEEDHVEMQRQRQEQHTTIYEEENVEMQRQEQCDFIIYEEENRDIQRQGQEQYDDTIYEEENKETKLNDLNNCDQGNETDPHNNDRISLNNSPETIVNNKSITELDDDDEIKMLVEYPSDESEEFHSYLGHINHECAKTEREFSKTEESFDKSVKEDENSISQFLIQLSARLKRLPYRQRSKLEIEFLRRLIEVEECLGSYKN